MWLSLSIHKKSFVSVCTKFLVPIVFHHGQQRNIISRITVKKFCHLPCHPILVVSVVDILPLAHIPEFMKSVRSKTNGRLFGIHYKVIFLLSLYFSLTRSLCFLLLFFAPNFSLLLFFTHSRFVLCFSSAASEFACCCNLAPHPTTNSGDS